MIKYLYQENSLVSVQPSEGHGGKIDATYVKVKILPAKSI